MSEMAELETMQKTLTKDTKMKIKQEEDSSLETVNETCDGLSKTLNGDRDGYIGFKVTKELNHQMKMVTELVSEERYMEADKTSKDIESRINQEKKAWKRTMDGQIENKVTVQRVKCMKEHEHMMREQQKAMDSLNKKLSEDKNAIIKKYNKLLKEMGLPPEIQKLGKPQKDEEDAEPKTANDFHSSMNGL